MQETCRTAANAELDYGDPADHPRLREVLAGYLRRVRAADTSPGQLITCSGRAQGLWALALSVLSGNVLGTIRA